MTRLLRCARCKRVITRTEWDSFVDRRIYRCCDRMDLKPWTEPGSDETPVSVWSGSFTVFGVEVKCHVLSDGRRVVERDSMLDLMNAMSATPTSEVDIDELATFVRWQKGFDAP